MKQTRTLIGDAGATFTRFLTLSPKCTPSRTGQLVGRHYHNVRPTNKSIEGMPDPPPGGGLDQLSMFEDTALFPSLRRAGYWTSIVGKVHNGQGAWLCNKHENKTDPFTHVSTLCQPCNHYWGTDYVVKDVGENTTRMETPLDPEAWSTYSHGQFGNRSTAFIRHAAKQGKPFFAYIGTTGPHLPSQPAPWHMHEVSRWGDDVRVPRVPSFNMHAADSHPSLAALPKIDNTSFVDVQYRDRLGALLSIDDLVANVVRTLNESGVLDNTYVIVSSDHGYHLGHWRLPQEKMWPFETDIVIPFWIRGPGIRPGTISSVMGMNMDIAPTLLDAAGVPIPSNYDGRSLLPLITGTMESMAAAAARWRKRTVISFAEGYWQYWYPFSAMGAGESLDPYALVTPPLDASGKNYTFDNPSNQWRMLRVENATHNISFIEWDPRFEFHNVSFRAFYDLTSDPFETSNLWYQDESFTPLDRRAWQDELKRAFSCRGTDENDPRVCD